MEMGLVVYDDSSETYSIAPCGYSMYLDVVRKSSNLAPEALRTKLTEQESLGTSAEECVLALEQTRVGSDLAWRVKHVALQDTTRGYDIESTTVDSDGCTVPRLIEVKAVPQETYTFYWTRCEMDAAKSLRRWYYLYLLPVGRAGEFRLDLLEIVCDPIREVLDQSEKWNVEEVAVQCRKVDVR